MRDTYLAQRLLRPRLSASDTGKVRAHHVFGGGMLGLTPEQWAILDPIFEIDYMGAAEYEWGVFPRTLAAMYDRQKELVGFTFELHRKFIPAHWKRREGGKAPRYAAENADIYVLCAEAQRAEIPSHIAKLVKGDFRLKESGRFDVLDPVEDEERLQGWLDLTNQYFFFSSREMWENACEKLFQLKIGGDEYRFV